MVLGSPSPSIASNDDWILKPYLKEDTEGLEMITAYKHRKIQASRSAGSADLNSTLIPLIAIKPPILQ